METHPSIDVVDVPLPIVVVQATPTHICTFLVLPTPPSTPGRRNNKNKACIGRESNPGLAETVL